MDFRIEPEIEGGEGFVKVEVATGYTSQQWLVVPTIDITLVSCCFLKVRYNVV